MTENEVGRFGDADRATPASPGAPTGLRHSGGIPNAVKQLKLRLHEDLWADLVSAAAKRDCSLNAYICNRLTQAIAREQALEEAAQIVEHRGRKIRGAVQPDRTAAAIRSAA